MLKKELLQELNTYQLTNDFITFYNNVNAIFENNRKENNNILISQFCGLGDAILSTCFVREIHKIYPSANIYLVIPEQYIEIYKNCNYVKVLPCNPRTDNMFTILEDLIIFCADNLPNINVAFSPMWDPKISSLFLNWLSGAPTRVGYGRHAKAIYFTNNLDYYFKTFGNEFNFDNYLLTDNIINPSRMYSEIDRKLYLLESFCKVKIKDKSLTLFNDQVNINKYLTDKKKIAVGLGGSNQNKKYPLNKWINILKNFNDYTLYLLDSNYVDLNIGTNLTGKLSLSETIELIKRCDLYVGHDTATAHVASACNVPCVILYKEAIEREKYMPGFLSYYHRYKPLTKHVALRPARAKDDCKNIFCEGYCCSEESHCICSIPEKKVISAMKQFLK